MKRRNLEIVVKALVRRIVFDGRRAVGVEYERGGTTLRAEATREVILAAGAVGSPHILQLSGVGAPDHLSRIGIPVRHELPGVGRNLQDHYVARISHRVSGMATVNERSRGLPLVAEVLRNFLHLFVHLFRLCLLHERCINTEVFLLNLLP